MSLNKFLLSLLTLLLVPSFVLFLGAQGVMTLKIETPWLRLVRVISPPLSALASSSVSGETCYVALTRESGNNGKLIKAIQSSSKLEEKVNELQFIELPCIEHVDGPDASILPIVLATTPFDYICITSPEAATVFLKAWELANERRNPNHEVPLGKIAVVGKATEQVLTQHGLNVAFVPSKATAKVLADELPALKNHRGEDHLTTVLYPASLQAKTNLEDGLGKRGEFLVRRLNTYDTLPAVWTQDQVTLARQCKIACFGSPSAVKGWTKNLIDGGKQVLAACIGETSAEECRRLKWDKANIFYPEKPGIEGWVDAVAQALQSKVKLS
jgi:uroporphyrinogen-III synthase